MNDASANAIAALAIEMKALVDRLEADWDEQHILKHETADRLHNLRERAERLFKNFA